MDNRIAKQKGCAHWFIDRGAGAAFVGYFIGWVVLQLFYSKHADGRWVVFGQSAGGLMYWPFISFPFLIGALAICGAGIGWLMSVVQKHGWLTKWSALVTGMIVGAMISMTIAALMANILDHWALTEYQFKYIYGYFFVKVAAVIGATSGALAGAYSGIAVAKAEHLLVN